jgi:nicotinamide-nucleotide amidase
VSRVAAASVAAVVAAVDAAARARGLTIGLAESATGGLVAAAITDRPGVSSWFAGSVVSYQTPTKASAIGVDIMMLDRYGPASEQIARAMASGARKRLGADIGISVTGVAGPSADERGVAPGTVYIGWAANGQAGSVVARLEGDRSAVRSAAVLLALQLLRSIIVDGVPR